jgi:hypothetical protein
MPPQYKFHKISHNFITWESGPLTTKRWLIAGCLGSDHTFYTHSLEHVYGWGCMHIRSHMVDLFIVNACHIGGHIKLLVSL